MKRTVMTIIVIVVVLVILILNFIVLGLCVAFDDRAAWNQPSQSAEDVNDIGEPKLYYHDEDGNDTLVEDVIIGWAADAKTVRITPPPEPIPTHNCPVHGNLGGHFIEHEFYTFASYENKETFCKACVLAYVIKVLKENIPQITEIR